MAWNPYYNRYNSRYNRRGKGYSLPERRSFWIGFGAHKLRRGEKDYLNGLREGKTGSSFRAGVKAASTAKKFT